MRIERQRWLTTEDDGPRTTDENCQYSGRRHRMLNVQATQVQSTPTHVQKRRPSSSSTSNRPRTTFYAPHDRKQRRRSPKPKAHHDSSPYSTDNPMSGIAGIYYLDGRPAQQETIDKMVGAMKHRGPDGIHTWREGSVALGHCMLHTTPESLHDKPANGKPRRQPCINRGCAH